MSDRYAKWLADPSNAGLMAAYSIYLRERDVSAVLPMPQLLRSGRSWRRCNTGEFAVPPRDAWPSMVPALKLVRELQRHELLVAGVAASTYRTESFNSCEGGSSLSRHRFNNAIDFDLPSDAQRIRRLCGFWRKNGSRLRFGLGFYDDRRVHVDTSGFRTWGGDYTRKTSPCASTNH